MEEKLSFTLNGKKTEALIDTSQTLLWVLRNHFGLTGTKYGCGNGFCGACTVLIDNEPVRSCQVPVSDIAGKNVVTIEGLEKKGKLHPVQLEPSQMELNRHTHGLGQIILCPNF